MPTLGVTVAIIQESQVLLTQRKDFPAWCLPGGGVDDGESLAQAAVREAREETGLQVVLTRLVGTYSRPNWLDGGAHEILFAARPVGGTLQIETDETLDARYCTLDELPSTLLWWHHRRILDAFGDATGVAWSQDAAWPLGDRTREELNNRRRSMDSVSFQQALPSLFERLCGRGRPDQEHLEVGSALDSR